MYDDTAVLVSLDLPNGLFGAIAEGSSLVVKDLGFFER